MYRLLGSLTLAALLGMPVRADDALKQQVAADLKRFYQERLSRPFIQLPDDPEPKESPPPWEAPLKQLATGKSEERLRAAEYLRELLSLALEHETGRSAPSRNTPNWGGGAEVPARDLRETVAGELKKASAVPDAVPVFRWYFENEKADDLLPPVLVALGKVDGKDADALRLELATRPHPNAVVAGGAIEQVTSRKGSLPADRLAELCQHHRSAVRAAARKLSAQQGGKDPGPFDAAKAIRTVPVRKMMDEVLAFMPDLPGPKAQFVTVTTRYLDDKKVAKETFGETGWLVRRDKDVVEIYSPHGWSDAVRPGEKKQIKHTERAPEGNGFVTSEIDVTVEVEVSPAKLDEVINKVAKSRAKDTAGSELSRQGELSGQFEGSGATLYEAILGAWLYQAGRDTEAARVLLPALDSLYSDRHFPEMVRHQLGDLVGHRMLAAFAGDRDYAATLKEARLIDRLYPNTRFHDYAKGFKDQLPRRTDDFTKFKLPTPAEWAELKKTLPREQQIDFLGSRLRLLNCFQNSQPGGCDLAATQYAEPCGMGGDASFGLYLGKSKVINPLIELTGLPDRPEHKDQPKGLNLTLRDVPALSRHLRDDWYMPTVEFWRNFHPDRQLLSTRSMVADVINDLAGKDVGRIRRWSESTPAEIDREIERINKWAVDNAGKSRVELDWDALKEELADGVEWRHVANRVERLLEAKQTAAYDVTRKFLEDAKTREFDKSGILRMYLRHDVKRAKDLAPKFLDAKQADIREAAALIVIRTGGDRARARRVIGDLLETAELFGNNLPDAVEELLKDATEESRREVDRVFANGRLAANFEPYSRAARLRIVKSCAAAGMLGPYQFYLRYMDMTGQELMMRTRKGEEIGTAHYSPSIGEAMAEEIVTQFAPNDTAVKEIAKKFPRPADRIGPLKEWLKGKAGTAKE